MERDEIDELVDWQMRQRNQMRKPDPVTCNKCRRTFHGFPDGLCPGFTIVDKRHAANGGGQNDSGVVR